MSDYLTYIPHLVKALLARKSCCHPQKTPANSCIRTERYIGHHVIYTNRRTPQGTVLSHDDCV